MAVALKSRTNPRRKSAFTLAIEAARAAAPLVTRCALCSWTFSGTAAEGREAARAHRAAEHPETPQARAGRRKSHCRHGHPLTVDNVRVDSNGQRRCRTCERDWEAKRSARSRRRDERS